MRTSKAQRQPASLAARLGRSTLLLAVAAVAALHGELLWRRIVAEEIFEPAVALRWLATAALLGGFARLRRRGVPLFYGRRALGLWVLVALLHLSVSVTGVEAAIAELDPAFYADLLLAVPITAGLSLATAALLLALATAARRTAAPRPVVLLREPPRPPGTSRRFLPQLSSRPPPR